MEKILVSRCLLGESVRYDGHHCLLDHPLFQQWQTEGRVVSVCPEVAGGLPTPRPAAEIKGGQGLEVITGQAQVITQAQEDITSAFLQGAKAAADLCTEHQIKIALLKANSPSCGNQATYDGTFTDNRVDGEGVTAATLQALGIHVFNETQLEALAIELQNLESEKP